MKIGILTYHRSVNYGAFLQAYALAHFVKKIVGDNHIVEIIDYHSLKAKKEYIGQFKKEWGIDREKFIQYVKFQICLLKLQKSKEKIVTDDMEKIKRRINKMNYDLIIAGSDEVWKVDGIRGFPNAYWLDFVQDGITRASYAASSRADISKLSEQQKKYMKKALDKFEYIGVRDTVTQRMVNSICGDRRAEINCDPAFLFGFKYKIQEYKEYLYQKYKIPRSKLLFGLMIPDNRLCQMIRETYGDKYYIISFMDKNEGSDLDLTGLSPFAWAKTVGCMDILVTNRFHGIVFALKYNIPFLAMDDYDEIECSKIYDLLRRVELEEFYFPYQGFRTKKRRLEALDRIDVILWAGRRRNNDNLIKRERKNAEGFFRYIKMLADEQMKSCMEEK